jgi:thiamine biosynthesis protein ThiS
LKIVLNGNPFEVEHAVTISELLSLLNIDPRRVAVEHNLVVVKRASLETTRIRDGDQVEIVNFVGGGSE